MIFYKAKVQLKKQYRSWPDEKIYFVSASSFDNAVNAVHERHPNCQRVLILPLAQPVYPLITALMIQDTDIVSKNILFTN